MTNVPDGGQHWTIEAINRLRELSAARVPIDVVAQAMHRPMVDIMNKAAELGLPIEPESRTH